MLDRDAPKEQVVVAAACCTIAAGLARELGAAVGAKLMIGAAANVVRQIDGTDAAIALLEDAVRHLRHGASEIDRAA